MNYSFKYSKFFSKIVIYLEKLIFLINSFKIITQILMNNYRKYFKNRSVKMSLLAIACLVIIVNLHKDLWGSFRQ